MRKFFAIAICLGMSCLALLWGLGACGAAQPEPKTETRLFTASAWYTEEGPEDGIGTQLDPDFIHVGLTYDGKRIFAFLRLPPEEDIGSLQSARLWLKLKESNGVPALQAGPVTGPWDADGTLAQARALAGEPLPAPGFRDEGEGWCSVDMTELLVEWGWLDGAPGYGLALFEGNPSTEAVFASCKAEADCPRLVITSY